MGTDHDEGEALQRLARRIEVLVPQAPAGENADRDKRKALHQGVRKFVWAEPIINTLSYSPRKPYKEFLHELAASEQNHRVASALRASSSRQPRTRPYGRSGDHRRGEGGQSALGPSGSRAADIWYAGQAQLGWDPKARRVPRMNVRYDRQCYNCGDKSHVVDKCTKPRDEVRVLKGRLRSMTRGKDAKTTIQVLKELLMEQSAHVNFLSEELCLLMSKEDEVGSDSSTGYPQGSDDVSQGGSSDDEDPNMLYNAVAEINSRASGYSIAAAIDGEESSDDMDF